MIGEKIREIRMSRGWTQEDLAKIARVTRQSIYLVENDRVSPTISLLQQIADALGVPVGYLLGEDVGNPSVEVALQKDKKLDEVDRELLLKLYGRLIRNDQNSANISSANQRT